MVLISWEDDDDSVPQGCSKNEKLNHKYNSLYKTCNIVTNMAISANVTLFFARAV